MRHLLTWSAKLEKKINSLKFLNSHHFSFGIYVDRKTV